MNARPDNLATRLRRFFRAYEAPEADAARFRARQMQQVLSLTPMAMSIQFACAVAVPWLLWGLLPAWMTLGWSYVVSLLAVISLRAWWRARRAEPRPLASPRALRRVTLHGGLLGAVWGALPLMAVGVPDPEVEQVIGILVTGMVCGGGFALAAVPQAGTLFVAVIGTGSALALALGTSRYAAALGLQLAGYAAVVVYTLWISARTMGARMVAEAQAEHQGEVIALLLRDFETHAADLLWEVDAQGRFARLSPRFARDMGLDADTLARERAIDVLARMVPDDEEAQRLWGALRDAFVARNPFRDLTMALQVGRVRRWWSMSASPLADPQGRFCGWRGVATEVTERQQALRRLNWLAHNDALTGLVNRRQFRERMEQLLPGGPTLAQPLALVMLDLDGFKPINDTLGHAAGDHILQVLGQRLLDVARRSDVVARLGGDEFALVLPGALREPEVQALLDRVLARLAEPAFFDGRPVALRASLGVAMAPRDGADVDTLMTHADIALYAAKRAGGHRHCFFTPGLAELGKRRASMQQALAVAVEQGQLRLVFQPQVDGRDGRVRGFEALLRWRHPELGDVPPGDFVPVAESAGLMPAIGAWVLEEACRHAAQWPGGPRVAVNVSATQLGDEDFVPRVRAACASLARGRLELEITESALIDDADHAVATLRALRELGVPIALDDFGTGYSALGYLRRFPFDTLKIDRSFVQDLGKGGEARVIVDTILAMARALRMSTVAEGVETEVEATMLRERGCDLLQGWLLSRPLEAADVLPFLQRWQASQPEPADVR